MPNFQKSPNSQQEDAGIRGFLRALRVLAVSHENQLNRQGTKDAKKTRRKPGLLRLGCSVLIRVKL